MLRIFLVVIVFFVAFLAISVSYARAFRVKNGVIDILEQYEGYTDKAQEKIDNYIKKMGYSCMVDEVVGTYQEQGNGGIIYPVTTCVNWNLPILNTKSIWKIKGQTEIIRNPGVIVE